MIKKIKSYIEVYKENLQLKSELEDIKKRHLLTPLETRLYINGKVNNILKNEDKLFFKKIVESPLFQKVFDDMIISNMEEMSAITPNKDNIWDYTVKHTELKIIKKIMEVFNTLSD